MDGISFELQDHLDLLAGTHPHRMRFNSSTKAEMAVWRNALRCELTRLLGILPLPPAAPKAELISRTVTSDYIQEKYALYAGESVWIPVYRLIPFSSSTTHTPILIFHGHEPGASYCMGIYPNEETERRNLDLENNYAQDLARAGYMAVVVEQRGLGERLSHQKNHPAFPRSCRQLAFSYLLHGRTLLGERIRDGMQVISWLSTLADVNHSEIGCTGHSGGGATALWLSALDERIKAVLVSGYFSSFQDSILAMEHCECNYVPDILELAEMGDIAALIAPRPFCALNGQEDPLFPVSSARKQMEIPFRAYTLENAADACSLKIHPGGHVYQQAISREWFATWLKK